MGDLKCIVCGRSRSREEAVVLQLTAEEKKALTVEGKPSPQEIVYCRPCHRLMADQATALDLMKGMMIMRLRALGVSNAEQLGEQFKRRLLARSKGSV